jgi:hypothetical protein
MNARGLTEMYGTHDGNQYGRPRLRRLRERPYRFLALLALGGRRGSSKSLGRDRRECRTVPAGNNCLLRSSLESKTVIHIEALLMIGLLRSHSRRRYLNTATPIAINPVPVASVRFNRSPSSGTAARAPRNGAVAQNAASRAAPR